MVNLKKIYLQKYDKFLNPVQQYLKPGINVSKVIFVD